MNKILMILLVAVWVMPGVIFAQEAKIIAVKGTVMIRKDATAAWEIAQLNMKLGKDAEVQTQAKATCTLSFDENKKSILTVKDETQIKVESVQPGKVYLPQGRVFALIKNIKETKKFEVRTPTAIAGARGTGWITEFSEGKTSIACLDDVVYVETLDDTGKITNEVDLAEGFELDIKEGEAPSEAHQVEEADKSEWQGFVVSVEAVIDEGGSETKQEALETNLTDHAPEELSDPSGNGGEGTDMEQMGDDFSSTADDFREDLQDSHAEQIQGIQDLEDQTIYGDPCTNLNGICP